MEWVIGAVLVSIINAFGAEVNRFLKLDGFRLNFWRLLFSASLLAPFLPWVVWPDNEMFYLTAMLSGVAGAIGTSIFLNMAAQHNGRVAGMHGPTKMFVLFFMWLIIDDSLTARLLANPLELIMIIGLFVLAAASIMSMRQNDVSWKAFVIVAPIGVMYAIADTFSKMVLGADNTKDAIFGVIGYSFVMYATGFVLLGLMIIARHSPERPLMPKGMLKGGMILGVISAIKIVIFFYAIIIAPNPAYVAAIMMLTPVWLMIYHRISGLKDDASPIAGLFLVISAIGLIIVTS